MTYDVNRTDENDPWVTINLNLNDYDISPWLTADGTFGLWLGIGYGTSIMMSADMTMCFYNFTNTTNDQFICRDGFISSDRSRLFNETNNIESNATLLSNFDFETNTANFSVSFVRPYNGTDFPAVVTEDDYNMDYNLTNTIIPIIWAFGDIVSG